jgi:hypothetical protein
MLNGLKGRTTLNEAACSLIREDNRLEPACRQAREVAA